MRPLVVAGLVLALSACSADEPVALSAPTPRATAAATATASPTPVALPPDHDPEHGAGEDELGIHWAPELDAAYLACARERGVDPEWAQVLVDGDERARMVKSGYEVPARVHGPCLVQLGGIDPGVSSRDLPQPPG